MQLPSLPMANALAKDISEITKVMMVNHFFAFIFHSLAITLSLQILDSPSAYFFSSIMSYNFISSMRSLASLMEPDALLSVPDCFSLA